MSISIEGVIEIPPSQLWEGADGLWSTFNVSIGTPAQVVRLLPGTSASAANTIWAVIEQGCDVLDVNITDCSKQRGGLFFHNRSSTWTTARLDNQGLFQLPLLEEEPLGLLGNDNAYYGFDKVVLGIPGTMNSWSISKQLIAGIATNDFFLGSLGLSPRAFNFSSFDDPVPSLLQNLRDSKSINSSTWSYYAGASYHKPPSLASLVLGGYDASRSGDPIQLPFYQDDSRDLVVSIQSIVYDGLGSAPLLASGIYAFLDTLVAQMWLPLDVCQSFEKAFNLTWNDAGFYFLSEEQHAALLAESPVFTFTLSNTTRGGDVIEIKLPYAAFDLNITIPYVNETQRYFPLKRATDSSQYTLGRVFFQELYIIADYDRHVFNISQALASNISQASLVSIQPPGAVLGVVAMPSSKSSIGKVVGIVIGGTVAVIAVVLAVLLMLKGRHRRRTALQQDVVEKVDRYPSEEALNVFVKELDGHAVCEMHANERKIELAGQPCKLAELHTVERAAELSQSCDKVFELPA